MPASCPRLRSCAASNRHAEPINTRAARVDAPLGARSQQRTQPGRLGEQVAQARAAGCGCAPGGVLQRLHAPVGDEPQRGFPAGGCLGGAAGGVPVVHFVCQGGMSRCVLGTDARTPGAASLLRLYRPISPALPARRRALVHLPSRSDLGDRYSSVSTCKRLLPWFAWKACRWARCACPRCAGCCAAITCVDDEQTRFSSAQYILSAWRVAQEFGALLDRVNPRAVVIFNGMFYPEAAARWLSRAARSARHLSRGRAAPIHRLLHPRRGHRLPHPYPRSFELTPEQDARLDAYLEQRLQGNFSMAGIRFWPEMRGLDEAFLTPAGAVQADGAGFHQCDLRHQPAALQHGLPAHVCLARPGAGDRPRPPRDALCHPRPPRRNPPGESRARRASPIGRGATAWSTAAQRGFCRFARVLQLLRVDPALEVRHGLQFNHRAGGLLDGRARCLCGGKARFTQLPTVFFPPDPEEYRRQARNSWLPRGSWSRRHFRAMPAVSSITSCIKPRCPSMPCWRRTASGPGYVRFKKLSAPPSTRQLPHPAHHRRRHPHRFPLFCPPGGIDPMSLRLKDHRCSGPHAPHRSACRARITAPWRASRSTRTSSRPSWQSLRSPG